MSENSDGKVSIHLVGGDTFCTVATDCVAAVVAAIASVPEIQPRTHDRQRRRLLAAQQAAVTAK